MVIFEDQYGILKLVAIKYLKENLNYADTKDRVEEYKDQEIYNAGLKRLSRDKLMSNVNLK